MNTRKVIVILKPKGRRNFTEVSKRTAPVFRDPSEKKSFCYYENNVSLFSGSSRNTSITVPLKQAALNEKKLLN